MNTRDAILKELEAQKGSFLSGEELADHLQVSRNAVWKAMKALQDAGYAIKAVRNRGYCLEPDNDILSAQSLSGYLNPGLIATVYDTLPSTNTKLKELAAEGAPEGTVILARHQSAGRGRTGRSFYSPQDTGIYMSLLLRPSIKASDALFITTCAAVATAKAIEEVSGKPTGIKWVNDIYMEDKKVCGILTEAAFHMETGMLDYVILGIGINLLPPENGFPAEIAHIASAVFSGKEEAGARSSQLAATVLNDFMEGYQGITERAHVPEYIRRSLLPGREITVHTASGDRDAVALGIDGECRLQVRFADGSEQWLSSGDVSVHLQ